MQGEERAMSDGTLTIHKKGDMYVVEGTMDGEADFQSLVDVAPPLKLNLKGVKKINSMGILRFLRFIAQWGQKPLECHECSAEFTDVVAMFPAVLGSQKTQGKIISFYAPFSCEQCHKGSEYLMTMAELGGEVTRRCTHCGTQLGVNDCQTGVLETVIQLRA
jgi:hypothetical protein